MIRKKLLMATAILIFASGLQAQEDSGSWTLKKCIEYAMENNISLQQSKISQQESEADLKEAKAGLFPSLSFSSTHSINYKPYEASQYTVSNGNVESANKTTYSGSYGLNASWTVWNGNKNQNNIKLEKLNSQAAVLTTQTTANSIQEEIAQLYVQILYSEDAVKVDKEITEISNKNAERGKKMVETGLLAKADLAELESQVATDEYNVVNAESQLASYKLQLKQLLRLNNITDFNIDSSVQADDKALDIIPSKNDIYNIALGYRPEIKNSRLSIQSADLNIAIAKSGYMPTINLTAGLESSNISSSSYNWGNQMKNNSNGSLGLSLSLPIFDNRSTKTSIEKAKLSKLNSELDLADQQNSLYSTIENYWLDATTNQKKFIAAQKAVESAQASFDLVNEQFRLGLKNVTELLSAKSTLLNAKQDVLQSKYTTILNQQLLKFYKGENLSI